MYRKQTYREIAEDYGKTIRWVQRMIDDYLPVWKQPIPQKTPLIVDVVFFGREFGVMVFRSPETKHNLSWKTVKTETVDDYESGIVDLIRTGFEISGVVVDGKPGVIQRIESLGISVQMCHFHQIQIVTRYTTKHPRLPVAQELRRLALSLPKTTQKKFEEDLLCWSERWKNFLKEKTKDPFTDRSWFTHRRLRQAHRSLKRHIPHLFTYKRCPGLPNTTNSLEGTFAHLKDKVRIHRGLSLGRKLKLILEILSK